MSKGYIAVSLFSGAGGLDYGFEAAGFTTAFATDFDHHCCETLRRNRSAWKIAETPVAELSATEILGQSNAPRGEVDVLFGGPPCQPFSKAAYWSRGDTLRLKDPRADTLREYFRLVAELKPRAFLLENVHGINYSGKEEGFDFILNSIRSINRKCGTDYRPVWRVLNAADYGVPQLRVRFIMVAAASGQEFIFPEPTHKPLDDQGMSFDARVEYVRAWDAIGGLKPSQNEALEVGGKWAELLPSIPEGENYLWHTNRKGGVPLFGWRTHYWSFLLKLAKNRPSWTVQAQPGSAIGPFHWENRRLSARELMALQTFPKDIEVSGPRVEVQRQVGNAVPSLLAEVIAREIRRQFFGGRISRIPKLAVQRQTQIPAPEIPKPVPNKYRVLIGNHPDHPGTGKGASYRGRAKPQSLLASIQSEFSLAAH